MTKPFGWYDHFNHFLYLSEEDAEIAENGGNKITPLYDMTPDQQNALSRDRERVLGITAYGIAIGLGRVDAEWLRDLALSAIDQHSLAHAEQSERRPDIRCVNTRLDLFKDPQNLALGANYLFASPRGRYVLTASNSAPQATGAATPGTSGKAVHSVPQPEVADLVARLEGMARLWKERDPPNKIMLEAADMIERLVRELEGMTEYRDELRRDRDDADAAAKRWYAAASPWATPEALREALDAVKKGAKC